MYRRKQDRNGYQDSLVFRIISIVVSMKNRKTHKFTGQMQGSDAANVQNMDFRRVTWTNHRRNSSRPGT